MDEHQSDFKDSGGVIVVDHLLIRDVDTKKVLVNQRGSSKTQDNGEEQDE